MSREKSFFKASTSRNVVTKLTQPFRITNQHLIGRVKKAQQSST